MKAREKMRSFRLLLLAGGAALLFAAGCRRSGQVPAAFVVRGAGRTGLHFSNQLHPTPAFNALDYLYYYNGAGIGAGDFNNDGKTDLFFAANQGDNKLFLNQGGLRFREVTKEAQIPEDGGWSTGVSVVDINNDGLLDIYICRVGNYRGLHAANQLLVCQGIDKNGVPRYRDEARQYGLDFSGFSTQAVFFDYDGDGDLDMYLLNHSVHENGTFGDRNMLLQKKVPVSGDRLYRNDGNHHFTDVTATAGIHSSVLGYGLGVAVSDVNLDGYPDIYVGNDFHENDYLYLNQHDGTFRDELTSGLKHTSKSTMGVDVADADNDGYPDIITMDMLSADPVVRESSLGEDDEDEFLLKSRLGYAPQYARNNLQWNRGNGKFSELGQYAGVAATGWSWSPLWMDFDNDGLKDLFVSNGIPVRLNNIDYLNYVTSNNIQQKLQTNTLTDQDISNLTGYANMKLDNRFFHNAGHMKFEDMNESVRGNLPTYSNGAVGVDLDNDGDLDIVVNDIDGEAVVYENQTNGPGADSGFVTLRLHGPPANVNAIGAKVIVFTGDQVRTYENFPVHGFMSSSQVPVLIGLRDTRVDSAFLVWPDNTFQAVSLTGKSRQLSISYAKGLPVFDYDRINTFRKNQGPVMEDITAATNLHAVAVENPFNEFDLEPLLPRSLSTEGPALAVSDVNHDGLQDLFLGAARGKKGILFIQQADGRFRQLAEPALDADSMYEDVDACFADVNGDGNTDLLVASGGDQPGNDALLTPRLYLGDASGHFTAGKDAFGGIHVNASCIVAADFAGDGHTGLFIGGRCVAGKYGAVPRSYLLENDGKGHFRDVTAREAPSLAQIGMVTSAVWCDIDGDGDQDLVITLDWGGVIAYVNERGTFHEKVLSDKKGWWNCIFPVDLNHDGKMDFVVGNLGLNSGLQASPRAPVRMYYNDFDDNGTKEGVVTHYVGGKQIPLATLKQLEQAIPSLKRRFATGKDFAQASLDDILTSQKRASSRVFEADDFASVLLMNRGGLVFSTQPLPWQAQLSCYRAAAVINTDRAGFPDVLLGGNFYGNSLQIGANDADFGTVLHAGEGRFSASAVNGLVIGGQVRHIEPIFIGGRKAFVLARNNDNLMVIRCKTLPPGTSGTRPGRRP